MLQQEKNAYEFLFLFVISCFCRLSKTVFVYFNLKKLDMMKPTLYTLCYILIFQMIKVQQLSLRNGAVRKLLGLPDIRSQDGHRAEKSPLEGPKMMQVHPFILHALVNFIICD